ncbi:hypothetical protein QVD17_03169 [Tagetes erecta]|uniref:RIN4 pathogenic type III effector avirulence factor Avr cleavage site domain-containing protein n=1 Tax=Tagetes erecta TaxID=13708 RepID=A0AAD8LD04_TARER|nr:hypothetical protein QVD17_03169 [Tagetes erecta]
MAHKSPTIPKFGDWDNDDNVSYATYFNNARRKYLDRYVDGHERVKQPPSFKQKRSIVPRSDHWEYDDNVSHGAYDDKPQRENLEPPPSEKKPPIIPNFGNWGTEESPYVPYFNNARKKRLDRHVDGHEQPPSSEQKPPIIPKFGNWGTEDSPYVPYFNNAKKERLDRHVDGNEQPPSSEQKHPIEPESGNRENEIKICFPPYIDYHVDVHEHVRGPPSCGRVRPPTHSPNPTMFHLHYHAKTPPSRGQVRPLDNSPNPALLRQHYQEEATVPKFGEWDENKPSSADSYDHIFKKIREEQASRSIMPSSSDAKSNYVISRNKKRNNKGDWMSREDAHGLSIPLGHHGAAKSVFFPEEFLVF